MDARREFIHLCSQRMDEISTAKALEAFDLIAAHYSMVPTETALTAYDNTGEPLLLYYIESQRLDGIKESTLRNKKGHIKHFLDSVNMPVSQITPLVCRGYMATVAARNNSKGQDITAGTYNSIRSSICSFFDWCLKEELILRNPMINIKKKKELREIKKSLSEYELEKLRRAAETEREKLIIETLIGTGCRISELRLLKAADFDFKNGTVLICGVKSSKYRYSIANGKMEAALDDYIAVKQNKSPYLFASERRVNNPQPISTKQVENIFRDICHRAGIKRKIRPHDMRHAFATMQLNSGTNVVTVQHLLGHQNLNTTQTYIDTTSLDISDARRHTA